MPNTMPRIACLVPNKDPRNKQSRVTKHRARVVEHSEMFWLFCLETARRGCAVPPSPKRDNSDQRGKWHHRQPEGRRSGRNVQAENVSGSPILATYGHASGNVLVYMLTSLRHGLRDSSHTGHSIRCPKKVLLGRIHVHLPFRASMWRDECMRWV